MEDQILKEIKEVRRLLSKMLGTSDLPARQQFSVKALDEAADLFKKLSIERKEWIRDWEISKIIRNAPYNSGKFIIEQFGFTNYFTRGKAHYFNRKDILALNRELRLRNLNLGRYMELVIDQNKFQKYLETIKIQKGKKKGKHFHIPEALKDIQTTPYSPPSEDIVKQEIAKLKEEFQRENLAEYIDVYGDTHAMFKYLYYWDHYLKPELKKRCRKWCDEFNYANDALKKILSQIK